MKLQTARNVWSHFSRRKMSSAEVRHSFIKYFVQNGHTHVPSSSVLPEDESLLFTTAGMNQFKSIFLGENSSRWKGLNKAVSHQKCIRAGGKHNDLDDVGKDLHHQTFFEMLGNWSFNDAYDKETACRLAWSYLVDVLKIDPDRLYVTYFGRKETGQVDLECKRIWEKIGIPSHKIICFDSDNFWEMGATGPCGGCTEIHYDRVPNRKDAAHLVNRDNSVIELWNVVFMNQNRDSSGQIQPLPKSHIDTGMGFERLVSVLQDVNSNYDTDLFSSLTKQIAKMSRTHNQYTGTLSPGDSAVRLIADHIRGCTIAIQDGALPAFDGPGHIIRKMLRRSFLQSANTLKIDRGALPELVPIVADTLKSGYPELLTSIESIQKVVADEERNFWLTVDKAKKRFDKMVRKLGPETTVFPGSLTWELYTGNGLPLDITIELAREKGKEVDLASFNELKQKAREHSKKTSDLPQSAAEEVPLKRAGSLE